MGTIAGVDTERVDCKDGKTDWMYYFATFDSDGEHEFVWTYLLDGWLQEDEGYSGCMWVVLNTYAVFRHYGRGRAAVKVGGLGRLRDKSLGFSCLL